MEPLTVEYSQKQAIDLTQPGFNCQTCKKVLENGWMLQYCHCVICSDCQASSPGRCSLGHLRATQAALPIFGLGVCGICYESMTDPVRILCGHTFCHSCNKTWHLKGRRQGRVECPACRSYCCRKNSCSKGTKLKVKDLGLDDFDGYIVKVQPRHVIKNNDSTFEWTGTNWRQNDGTTFSHNDVLELISRNKLVPGA
ncbi:hypothetical protein BX600DRAFT_469931 [Xylariales sp. PMI_506]|nr:hypothetical protein BX600DRAFT_469931 [Xylariales sp. PMI_506]